MRTYLATAGTRKVHIAFDFQNGAPTCDRREAVNARVAELTGEGREDLIATLFANKIAMSRLCGHCFPIRTRIAYKNHITASKNA